MLLITSLLSIFLIIGVHEYGHSFFAKRFGVPVFNFTVGMGPKLYSRLYKGTRYTLNLIPFAGFVSIDQKRLRKLSSWREMQVILAGPLANLLLCILTANLLVVCGMEMSFLPKMEWYLAMLFVTCSTVVLFLFLIPFTIYSIFDMFLRPIAHFDPDSSLTSVLTGGVVSESFITNLPVIYQFLVITYLFSLSMGSFNLVPMAMLDGVKIFGIVFARFPNFLKRWNWWTTVLFGVLIVFLIVRSLIIMVMGIVTST